MTTVMIDGGTTNTRLTMVQDGSVLAQRECPVGAGSTRNQLRERVREELAALEGQTKIDRICISGMITSENGLAEIAHIAAPAGRDELARAVRTVYLPEITHAPILCIPGVKTLGETPAQCDMMRGEETEVMGDLWAHPGAGRRMYLHFGSHNKAIRVENGKITASVTTISGELLAAVLKETIVGSSAGGWDGFHLDAEAARKGYRLCEENGLSRALFQGRLSAVLGKEKHVLSMLVGMLCCEDARAFASMMEAGVDELVLYGRDAFIDGFRACWQEMAPEVSVRVIDHAASRMMYIQGMQAILQRKEQVENA